MVLNRKPIKLESAKETNKLFCDTVGNSRDSDFIVLQKYIKLVLIQIKQQPIKYLLKQNV